MGDDANRDMREKPRNPNATRDHLANERTFLAWVRSCIAIMALGFVVARFGLLIRELGQKAPRPTPVGLSTGFGVALVVCGALLAILAALRYRATTRAIDHDSYHPSPWLIALLSGGLVVVALLLVAYLVLAA
jgi:putative membrane protein